MYACSIYMCCTAVPFLILISDDTDEHDVYTVLLPIASRWRPLGSALGLSSGTLAMIQKDNHNEEDRLSDVVTRWLKRQDNVRETNYQLLEEAVRSRAGGNDNALAEKIKGRLNRNDSDN